MAAPTTLSSRYQPTHSVRRQTQLTFSLALKCRGSRYEGRLRPVVLAAVLLVSVGAVKEAGGEPVGLSSIGDQTVLTFEGIAGGNSVGISDYGRLTWENFAVLNSASSVTRTGYTAGTVSGDSVAFNENGFPAQVTGSRFTFESGYFTAAWREGLAVQIGGFLGGTKLFSATLSLNPYAPTFFNADWSGIDRLRFASSGGTDVFGEVGGGTHFALDNFAVRQESESPVPEPATMLLVASGLTSVLALRHRGRRLRRPYDGAA